MDWRASARSASMFAAGADVAGDAVGELAQHPGYSAALLVQRQRERGGDPVGDPVVQRVGELGEHPDLIARRRPGCGRPAGAPARRSGRGRARRRW